MPIEHVHLGAESERQVQLSGGSNDVAVGVGGEIDEARGVGAARGVHEIGKGHTALDAERDELGKGRRGAEQQQE